MLQKGKRRNSTHHNKAPYTASATPPTPQACCVYSPPGSRWCSSCYPSARKLDSMALSVHAQISTAHIPIYPYTHLPLTVSLTPYAVTGTHYGKVVDVHTARHPHALLTRVGLSPQLAAQAGIVAVAVAVAVGAGAGAVVYEAQKGIADGAFRLSARRQLSAAQARLARSGSLGAGVWEGVVEVDARGRGRERVRRVRSVRIISERLFGVGFVMRLGLSFEGDGAYVFEGCGGSLCTFLNRGCW
jgi:hypothetical protein